MLLCQDEREQSTTKPASRSYYRDVSTLLHHQLNNMEQSQPQFKDRVLQVNCSWRKNTIIVTEPGHDDPLYVAKMSPWSCKTTWRTGPAAAKAIAADSDSDSNVPETDIIGEGRIHPFKIDCQTQIRGRTVRVSAAKKWLTRYNYSSTAYSSDANRPAILTWNSNSKWKCLDFDLRDEDDQLVARFNPRYLGVRKLATFEMFGAKAWDSLAVEEVLITGFTLYICMAYRMSNIVPFVGAAVARPGKDYKVTEQEAREEEERNLATTADEFLAPQDAKFETPENLWQQVDEGTTMKEPLFKETVVR